MTFRMDACLFVVALIYCLSISSSIYKSISGAEYSPGTLNMWNAAIFIVVHPCEMVDWSRIWQLAISTLTTSPRPNIVRDM